MLNLHGPDVIILKNFFLAKVHLNHHRQTNNPIVQKSVSKLVVICNCCIIHDVVASEAVIFNDILLALQSWVSSSYDLSKASTVDFVALC